MRGLTQPWGPLLEAVRGYRARHAGRDLLAGITVGVVALPQSMAYAVIAGVHPSYGVYTLILQCLIGSLLNSQKLLALGPINTQSLLAASVATYALRTSGTTHGTLYLQIVFALTLLKGVTQLLMSAVRLGALVKYVSSSVIVGFTAGAGVLIAVGQMGPLLGVAASHQSAWPGLPGVVMSLWPQLSEVAYPALMTGALAMAVMMLSRAVSVLVPGALLAIVGAALLAAGMGWNEAQLRMVPAITAELPTWTLPMEGLAYWESLLSGAVALSLLGLMETYAIGRAVASKTGQHVNANQELFAQGLTHLVTGFLQCIPGSGSFTRTALNHRAGAASAFSGIICGLFVLAAVTMFGSWASYVPSAALAGVLVVIAAGLIDWGYFLRVLRTNRGDAAVCFGTLLATLLLPLAYAVLLGIALNIALYLHRASKLHIAQVVTPGSAAASPFLERPLTDRSGQESVLFLQLEGDLFFAVADELQDRFTALAQSPVRVVILRLKRTHGIDTTALDVFDRFVRQMRQRQGHVLLCGVKTELMSVLEASGFMKVIGRENVFEASVGVFTSAKRALARARTLVGSSIDSRSMRGLDSEDENAPEYVI